MAQENNTISGYQPDTIQGEERSGVAEIPRISAKGERPLWQPAVTANNAELKEKLQQNLPLTIYEQNSKIPLDAEILDITPLWNSNIADLQQKAKELDVWIKARIYGEGYNETTDSYQEIIKKAIVELNLSANLSRVERLNRLHTYFKVMHQYKENKKKATG